MCHRKEQEIGQGMNMATITKPVKNLWGRSEKSMTTSTMFSYYSSTSIKPASHSSVFQPSLHSISSSSFHLRPKSWNFISLNESSSFPGNSISINTRNLFVVSASKSDNGSQESSFQGAESFFRSVLASMEKVYLNRNPSAKQILELVQSVDSNQICYDHMVNGYGIDSMDNFFLDFGYEPWDELRFPAKKLKALLFSPPGVSLPDGGSGTNGPLPRIFISELLVDHMSTQTQVCPKDHLTKRKSQFCTLAPSN